MNTIGEMQNEKYFYGLCKKAEYNHDFEKIDDVLSISYNFFETVIRFCWSVI